jgi:hypothetical protein
MTTCTRVEVMADAGLPWNFVGRATFQARFAGRTSAMIQMQRSPVEQAYADGFF